MLCMYAFMLGLFFRIEKAASEKKAEAEAVRELRM